MRAFRCLCRQSFKGRDSRCLVLGLDGAGKTSILWKLCLAEPEESAPIAGFATQTIKCESLTLTSWDVGGSGMVRCVWRRALEGAHGVMFVVDSTDSWRLDDAREELERLLDENALREAALLVCANKQDCANALSPEELAQRLGLKQIVGRPWRIQGTCALTADGLCDGLEWLGEEVGKRI